MKEDPALTVVQGRAKAASTSRRRPRKQDSSSPRSPAGVVLLISRENRQAWKLTPEFLEQAEELLRKVQGHLAQGDGLNLVQVHGLSQSCLVRLR